MTNEMGQAVFRGFYGTYEVEIERNGKIMKNEIKLLKNHQNDFVLMI